MRFLLALLVICFVADATAVRAQTAAPDSQRLSTRGLVMNRVRLFGHRNWIVIADSAYPAQTAPGIETIVTGKSQLEIVQLVLQEIAKAPHVRPVVHLDHELEFVSEQDAPGIAQYRKNLKKLLAGQAPRSMPHEKIIEELDEAGKAFRILVLKTNLTLPYTSVFIRLDAGYWSDEAEARLRKAMSDVSGPDQN